VTLIALLPFLSAPLAVLASVALWRWCFRAPDDHRVIEALDRVLAEDSAVLRETRTTDPLRFRTSEQVRLGMAPLGAGPRPGRVQLVRTIRAATAQGFRLRVRAFARGSGGRTLVRWVDVEVGRGQGR